MDLPAPTVDMELSAQSPTSSTSSFIPIDYKEQAIQVINERKEFNEGLLDYIDQNHGTEELSEYHIVSVFGSQSTGKSTLLNKLFNTNFDVMDENSRQQTTKGIWMAHSPVLSTHNGQKTLKGEIFVMDVEGTDGRERGEDQDFERKAALFAIATSEVLIVNIWETQVGLYQGANMGLLKTVFEVNLSLFGSAKLNNPRNNHKLLILIVIRDHIGVTPLLNLLTTLKTDLVKMWDNLNKPAELEHFTFDDFFDLDFHALHHKVLQANEFQLDVKDLGERFAAEDAIFKPEYHHNIPIEGWTMYAESCWEQINTNKDLDLPTQQILVAKFKCDEILQAVFEEFLEKYESIFASGVLMVEIFESFLEQFDHKASRYNTVVYEERKEILEDKMQGVLKQVFDNKKIGIEKQLLDDFASKVAEVDTAKFSHETSILVEAVMKLYLEQLAQNRFVKKQLFENDLVSFKSKIDSAVDNQREEKLKQIVNKSIKKVNKQMNKLIKDEVYNKDPGSDTWANIVDKFYALKDEDFEGKYSSDGNFDFGLGTSADVNSSIVSKFELECWNRVYQTIKSLINKDTIGNIMKDRFEDKFRYDESGRPKMYTGTIDLEKNFTIGKSAGLLALEWLSTINVNIPETTVDLVDVDESDDEEAESNAAQVIKESDKSVIEKKFKREIDAQFIEAKRAMLQKQSAIPYYLYPVLLILAWPHIMTLLRNPFLLTFTFMIGGSIYFLYATNMIGPAKVVATRMIDEVVLQAKHSLREMVKDGDEGMEVKVGMNQNEI